MELVTVLILISSFSFIGYGIGCLVSEKMKQEFKRYGPEKLRVTTGALEILGGTGLLVGLQIPIILKISSAGLALLMFCALFVRAKINDRVIQSLPALVLMLVNLAILFN